MEVHVRNARHSDVDAAVRLMGGHRADQVTAGARDADLLRTLLYLPSATVVVAEVERRIVGLGVLAIRPSVRPGPFIGSIDALAAADEWTDADGADDPMTRLEATRSIVEQLLQSARNKGCARVEVTDPQASAEPALFERLGFASRGTLLSREIGS